MDLFSIGARFTVLVMAWAPLENTLLCALSTPADRQLGWTRREGGGTHRLWEVARVVDVYSTVCVYVHVGNNMSGRPHGCLWNGQYLLVCAFASTSCSLAISPLS